METINNMSKSQKNKIVIIIFSIIFVITFFVSFIIGQYNISITDVVKVLLSTIFPIDQTWSNQIQSVILNIRLPRILAAALIGAGLSVAGAAYQGLFQNPMVSPDVLGASEGAGFGASLALLLSFSFIGVSITAFIFGILAVLIAYLISLKMRTNKTLGMVLAGIMIGSLLSASTSFIKLVADTQNVLPAITYWLMGSLASVKASDLLFASVPILLGIVILVALRWRINLMTMGEDEARTMGVNTKAMRAIVIICATVITAASVAIGGMIGWVGLVIPHFSRMIVGHDYKIMLPTAMLMGASYLMIVDNLSRTIASSEIPIGILTAFIGAPFFLYLIVKRGDSV